VYHGRVSVDAIPLGTVVSLVAAKELVRGAERMAACRKRTLPSNVRTRSERYRTSYSITDTAQNLRSRHCIQPGPHPILRSLTVSGLMCFMSSAFSATPARPRHQSSNAFSARYYDMIGQIGRAIHGGASPSGIVPRNSSTVYGYSMCN
jgi:hypothetical protein